MEHAFRSVGRAAVVAALVALAGCTATIAGPAYPPGYGPQLVSVSPGVSVIADYDEPIFFSGGFYWLYRGGGWYRSPSYARGWVHAAPPPAIMRINRPYAYRHYRPPGWRGYAARPQPSPRGWRGGPAPGAAPVVRTMAPPPTVRRVPPPPNRAQARQQQGRAAPPPPQSGGWRGAPPPPPR